MKIRLKKWKCTICGAKGKKWQCSWKANRSGRFHINKKHNGNGKLKILKRKKYLMDLNSPHITPPQEHKR